jgi:Cu(I)/Ag(I) efflux system membrane protein CusA/SilA
VIQRVIDWSLENRFLVFVAYVALAGWGWWALMATPVDAIPDLSDNQVIVFTDWPGHSPQEVEDQVTYPLTVNLQGLSGVKAVRSQSAFGFSMIYVVFEDAVDLYFARARVLERLNLVSKLLPANAIPTLGPDATGVGHIFWYALESDRHSLRELRAIQDWFVRYQLNAVPGVAEVASVGGHVQQYQVDVDPNRLRTFGLPLSAVVAAVGSSNSNVGGNVIDSNGTWSYVRGVGLVTSVEDIEQIVVSAHQGVPVYVRDVGRVQLGDAFRVASLVKGSTEAVGGVVVARSGVNAKEVIDAVKDRIEQISPGLPQGVRIVAFYDRSRLIEQAIATLRVALLEEILLVTLAHVLFLMHFRSILIVTIPLPLAVLTSFLFMYYAGITSNIMSLAGIAIAIGVLVDAGIVVTENALRWIEQNGVDTRDRDAVWRAVLAATRLVGRPVFFSMAIILLAFIPVFALTGQEGKLFHPLAFAKTSAVLAATVIAVTMVPVLCTWLIGGRVHGEQQNPVMRVLQRAYRPVLEAALHRPVVTVLVAASIFVGALGLATGIGSEFMPPLNEGDIMFMPIADPAISLEENTEIAKRQNAALMQFPEVEWAVAKVARADTSTDPAPLNMTETIVHLKPREQWRPGMTPSKLRAEMSRNVQTPGVTNIWTMPIINRIDMLTTGIRSEVGVKILGSDLAALERAAREVADVIRTVPGASNVYPEPVTSGQYLNIRIDRTAAARYGIGVGAIQEVIEHAIGETVLGLTIEGRERFPIRVRYAPEFRAEPRALGEVVVAAPNGAQLPLSALASIEATPGPAMISSENGLLLATVLLNVQGRDVGGFVEEARRAVASKVSLPPGYFLAWSGRYEAQERAAQRLLLVVPLVLAIIYVLLYLTYRSFLEAAHVLLAVPFALSGGIYLIWLLGYNFSVAVWVGFIALFGTAVQTGMVMVVYLEEAVARKRREIDGVLTLDALRSAVVEGALLRLRPKVMTVATVVAGLLPIMWSSRVGAEVMKPLAAPVLGGMVSSLLHVLIVTPVVFFWLRRRELRRPAEETSSNRPEAPVNRAPVAESSEPVPHPMPSHVSRVPVALIALGLLAGAAVWLFRASSPWGPWGPWGSTGSVGTVDTASAGPVQTVRSGDLSISVFAPEEGLARGNSELVVEFRSASTGGLVDVGALRARATMSMPGMLMTGGNQARPAGEPGRYVVTGRYGMGGAWQMTLEWDGPGGGGSASFEVDVQ